MHTFLIRPDVLKAALLFAAKSDVRYCLNGVLLERRADSRRLVATDGHRLICVNLPDLAQQMNMQHEHEGDEMPPTGPGDAVQYIVPRSLCEKAVKALGKETYLTVRCGGDCASINGMKEKLIDRKYPDYARIVPREVSGEFQGYNGEYLADMSKARKLLGEGVNHALIQLAPNGDGPGFARLNEFAFAVIMGVRRSGEAMAGPDAWYAGPAPRTLADVIEHRDAAIARKAVSEADAARRDMEQKDAEAREAARQDALLT
jgi:hypothetical protein